MKRAFLISICAFACCLVIFSCASCCHGIGWWLGIKPPPLPQQVITNEIGIKKVELLSTTIKEFSTSSTSLVFSMDLPHLTQKEADFQKKLFGKFVSDRQSKVSISDVDYYVALDYKDNLLFIAKCESSKTIRKKISHPRAIYNFAAFAARFGSNEYLVICTENAPRSNSSLLLILDTQLNVVYEEHCQHSFEAGLLHHESYGDCVIVKNGKFHPTTEKGDEKYYVYYLPERR